MKLQQLLQETDALTYINALKVTQTEIKNEVSEIATQVEHLTQAIERIQKLVRKGDNQYRLVAKLVNRQVPVITEVTVVDDTEDYEELMKEV